MTFLDLFSGGGMFRKGMEQAGHTCVGYCEIDKYARSFYESINEVKEDEWTAHDIGEVRASELPRADIWCAGFPCQDISVSGKQRGFSGERSSLFFTVTELIRKQKEENRPKYLFFENVKNLLSVNRGYDFLALLIELDEIGYDAEWKVINSAGWVPQNRERIFIIGHKRGADTKPIFDGFPEPKCRETVMDIVEEEVDEKYFLKPEKVEELLEKMKPLDKEKLEGKMLKQIIGGSQGERVYLPSGVSATLGANGGGMGIKTGLYIFFDLSKTKTGITEKARCLQARYDKGLPNRTGEVSGILLLPFSTPSRIQKKQNGCRFKDEGEPMYTLTAQDAHGVCILSRAHGYNKGGLFERCPTITTSAFEQNHMLLEYMGVRVAIRRLTPKECFRLQGLSDADFEKVKEISDTQLYRIAGNGVTVPVIRAIGERFR